MPLIKSDKPTPTSEAEQIIHAHEFLAKFLDRFALAKRGGVHDFIEMTMFNMINAAIKRIDDHCQATPGAVDANEIMQLTVEAYTSVLDKIKRNLDTIPKVDFK